MIKKMAKRTRISAKECNNLRVALASGKYSSPGVLARLLLEAFLYEDGDINADWFVREKTCTKGGFTKLRDRLAKDGWINFREDTKKYFAGVRLRNNLEAVKAAKAVTFADLERKADKSALDLKADKSDLDLKADRNEIDKKADRSELSQKADRSELEETRARLEETNRAMAKIADAVRDLQEAMLPPDTEEKRKRRERAAREIARQSRAN